MAEFDENDQFQYRKTTIFDSHLIFISKFVLISRLFNESVFLYLTQVQNTAMDNCKGFMLQVSEYTWRKNFKRVEETENEMARD